MMAEIRMPVICPVPDKLSTPAAVAVAHVQKQPVRPSERIGLALPPALDDVIMRCLAKNPADRSQSATHLARALADSACNGAWTQEDTERWWRMHLPDSFSAEESNVPEALSLAN